jgi:hypothetical protein
MCGDVDAVNAAIDGIRAIARRSPRMTGSSGEILTLEVTTQAQDLELQVLEPLQVASANFI